MQETRQMFGRKDAWLHTECELDRQAYFLGRHTLCNVGNRIDSHVLAGTLYSSVGHAAARHTMDEEGQTSMLLTHKVAIVTGGDSGIGHAISVGLGGAGAAVTINYHRNQAAAEEALRQITQARGRAQPVPGDG